MAEPEIPYVDQFDRAPSAEDDFSYEGFRELEVPKKIIDFAASSPNNAVIAIKTVYNAHKILANRTGYTQVPYNGIQVTVTKHAQNDRSVTNVEITEKRFSALVSDGILQLIDRMKATNSIYDKYKPLVEAVVPISSKLGTPVYLSNTSDDSIKAKEVPKKDNVFFDQLKLKYFRGRGSEFIAPMYPEIFVMDVMVRVKFPVEMGLDALATNNAKDFGAKPQDPNALTAHYRKIALYGAAHRTNSDGQSISDWLTTPAAQAAVKRAQGVVDKFYKKLSTANSKKLSAAIGAASVLALTETSLSDAAQSASAAFVNAGGSGVNES